MSDMPKLEIIGYAEKEELYKESRKKIFGLYDPNADSKDSEIVWKGISLGAAFEEWKKRQPCRLDITGWEASTLFSHEMLEEKFRDAIGTYTCWICGVSTPHTHSNDEVEECRKIQKEIQASDDEQWSNALKRVDFLESRYPYRIPVFSCKEVLALQDRADIHDEQVAELKGLVKELAIRLNANCDMMRSYTGEMTHGGARYSAFSSIEKDEALCQRAEKAIKEGKG